MLSLSPPREAPFRFLDLDEFNAMTREKRIEYIRSALAAIKSGRPLRLRLPKRGR